MNAIMSLAKQVARATEDLDAREAGLRRQRRWDRATFALYALGAVGAIAATCRGIDNDEPWWLLTIGTLIAVAWSISANNEWARLNRTTHHVIACQEARLALAVQDFELYGDIMATVPFTRPVPDPEQAKT